jgi:hypothetical protein
MMILKSSGLDVLARSFDGSTAAHLAVQTGSAITSPTIPIKSIINIIISTAAIIAIITITSIPGFGDAVLLMLRWTSCNEQEQTLLKLGLSGVHTTRQYPNQAHAEHQRILHSLTPWQDAAASSIGASLTSATYAALQTGNSSLSDGGNGYSSSIKALLAHVKVFPDMLTEDEKMMRLERYWRRQCFCNSCCSMRIKKLTEDFAGQAS